MTNVVMKAPSGVNGKVQTEFGTYSINTLGYAAVDSKVVDSLLGAGWLIGYAPQQLNLLSGFQSTGAAIPAAAAAGTFGVTLTPGTSFFLIGEASQNNTKTDTVYFEYQVPSSYIAGTDLVVRINAGVVIAAGTTITKTVDCTARIQSSAGVSGADICATAAQTLGATAVYADFDFTITGTTIQPGDKLLIGVVTAINEAGNTGTCLSHINSVSVQ